MSASRSLRTHTSAGRGGRGDNIRDGVPPITKTEFPIKMENISRVKLEIGGKNIADGDGPGLANDAPHQNQMENGSAINVGAGGIHTVPIAAVVEIDLVGAYRSRTISRNRRARVERKYYPEENLFLRFMTTDGKVQIIFRTGNNIILENMFTRGTTDVFRDIEDAPLTKTNISNVRINSHMYTLIYSNKTDQVLASGFFLESQGQPGPQ